MNIFSKLSKPKTDTTNIKELLLKDDEYDNRLFILFFLFDKSIKLNIDSFRRSFRKIDSTIPVTIITNDEFNSTAILIAKISFYEHEFKITRFDSQLSINFGSPVPEHSSYFTVEYKGSSLDTLDIYQAYLKVAFCFLQEDLIAILNPYSCNILDRDLIKNDKLIYRPTLNIWRNIVTLSFKEKKLLTTRGNNNFGIYEIASFMDSDLSPSVLVEVYDYLFNYLGTNTSLTLAIKDTIKIPKYALTIGKTVKVTINNILNIEGVLKGIHHPTLICTIDIQ